MRSETGQAVLAATAHLTDSGQPLSSLVSRIAVGRGPAAAPTPVRALSLAAKNVGVLPAAGLVSAPPADRRLPCTEGWISGVALLAAHGGAGVSCLCLVPGSVEALNSRGAGCSDEVVTAVQFLKLDRRDESEFAV